MVINVNERMNECRLYFSFCIFVVLEPTSRFFFSHSGCILLIFSCTPLFHFLRYFFLLYMYLFISFLLCSLKMLNVSYSDLRLSLNSTFSFVSIIGNCI